MLTPGIDEELNLIERLRKIETLFALSAPPSDRHAAESAPDRIRRRLAKMEESDPAVEFRFSLADDWSTSLFIALLRRYGLRPYRYTSQRRTTVVVKVARSFVDEVLWPEFQQVNATLRSHLDAVTNRIIHKAIYGVDVEVEERTSARR
jgi:hypothetical protein